MHRRSLLKLGLLSAAVLAVAGVPLALLRPGLQGARLSGSGREVFAAAARAILDGSLPSAGAPHERALASLLDRIDALVANLPSHVQSELSQLLAVLASGAGRRTLAGLEPDWSEASVAELQDALKSMRVSSLSLRQQAYHALHDIVGGAYFSESSTWTMLGYPGPVAV